MAWLNSSDDWPNWGDTEKRIRLLMGDGSLIEGRLEAEEFFDGEDEIPVFYVRTDGDALVSFADCEKFTFDLAP
jgi:hypothetical protein